MIVLLAAAGVSSSNLSGEVMTRPRRKWYLLSIRGAMLLILFFGLGLGWLGRAVHRANEQRRAVAAVRKSGGMVLYDHQFSAPRGRPNPSGWGWVPTWLRDRLGDDFFHDVKTVQFFSRPVTDDDLAPLATFDRLEELSISGSPITDAGLRHIAGLGELRTVSLFDDRGLTDAGVAHLAGLTKLRTLALDNAGLTDAGLAHLGRMTDLETLMLQGTRVTGPGLAHLGRMPNLKKLYTPADEVGMAHIGRLTGLQELYAYDTRSPTPGDGLARIAGLRGLRVLVAGRSHCSDAGLARIAGLSNLTDLDVGGDRVTDAGLAVITGFKSLQVLNVTRSKVTDQGLASLTTLLRLRHLDLQDSERVSDAGMLHVKALGGLQVLGLGGTSVGDAGLAPLTESKSLGRLVVGRRVSDRGIEAVRQALPRITIIRY
jgi:hypothetical protein